MKNLIIYAVLMKINIKKYHCSNFFLYQKLKSRVSLIQLKSILGYFLAWFQSLQLPSTQSESPRALIPLDPKSHVSFLKYVLNCEQNSSYFDPKYPHTRINEDLMYFTVPEGSLPSSQEFSTGLSDESSPFPSYVGVLISFWLFLFASQPKEFFLDGLKTLEQRSHKRVALRGEYVE
jgi:hypothetical protein